MSMLTFAVGTLPLIQQLKDFDRWVQIWYANDTFAIGDISLLHDWIKHLMKIGLRFGYFPEPLKSYLVVNESLVSCAEDLFHDVGVKVVTS